MVRRQGFALFEVLLALVLMMIAAAASYTLVKSFRSNSSVQQFIRYSTNITQSFMPFVDGVAYDSTNGGPLNSSTNTLSTTFLKAIAIPAEDQVMADGAVCTNTSCYVNSGMYLSDGEVQNAMSFAVQSDTTQLAASYFLIAVEATGLQVNQILQSASSLFSVYCPAGAAVGLDDKTTKCKLQSDAEITTAGDVYSLFLVFPKSGDVPPTKTGLKPLSE